MASATSDAVKRLVMRYSSPSRTSYTSTPSEGSIRRRSAISPMGVSAQASSSIRGDIPRP